MSDQAENNSNLWYIKKSSKITGPFPVKLLGSYLILGRIDLQTLVSTDQEKWIAIGRLPSLIPDEIKNASTAEGKVAIQQAKSREDERRGDHRRDTNRREDPNKEGKERAEHQRREAADRRKNNEEISKSYLHLKADFLAKKIKAKKRAVFGAVVLAITVVALMLSFFFVKPLELIQKTDCTVKAGPNIDWSACNKNSLNLSSANLQNSNLHSTHLNGAYLTKTNFTDANLSYSNLSNSNLSNANLSNSRLVGANLNNANLSGANLSGADLSYADLRKATITNVQVLNTRFDNAIWIDGTLCARQSIDRCIPVTSK